MLTSSNQYLRPEYLSPLPTTLDSKKSPLALLAQTCSNIGADNPNSKPLISSLEKSKEAEKSKEKSFSCYDKSSFKPYESLKKEDIDVEKKTPPSKSGSPDERISPTGDSIGSCGKSSPQSDGEPPTSKSNHVENSTPVTTSASSSPSSSTTGTHCTLRGLGYNSGSLGLDLARADTKDGITPMSHLALGMYKSGLSSLNCTGCIPVGGHIPVDAATAPFPVGVTQSGLSQLRPGGYSASSGLSPYLGYARVKTNGGGTTLVPLCRDPYCTNCQLGLQSAQLPPCPSGCTQCTHDRLTPALGPAGHGLPGMNPSYIPSAGSVSGLNPSLYPMLSRPNICSWMVGDTYCGKRFSTSEELLQHLRTHTSISATDSSSIPLFTPSMSLAGAFGSACPLSYSTAPSLTSTASLRRTYPTSVSPVTSLSAAGRYHPYKPPPLASLTGTALPSLQHPTLGMYYSPYSMYGQRLGPPVHP